MLTLRAFRLGLACAMDQGPVVEGGFPVWALGRGWEEAGSRLGAGWEHAGRQAGRHLSSIRQAPPQHLSSTCRPGARVEKGAPKSQHSEGMGSKTGVKIAKKRAARIAA